METLEKELLILARAGYVKMFKTKTGNSKLLDVVKNPVTDKTMFVNKHNITTSVRVYESHGKEKDNQVKIIVNWFIRHRRELWIKAEHNILEKNLQTTLISRIRFCLSNEFMSKIEKAIIEIRELEKLKY